MSKVTLPTAGSARHALRFDGAERFYVGRSLIMGGLKDYEAETFAAIAALIETRAIHDFADVGANVGIYSLTMKAMFPQLAVRAFEPTPELAAAVRSLAQLNDLDIDLRELALSNFDGTASFFLSDKTDASNSLNQRFRNAKRSVEVKVARLDSVVADGWKPQLFKIDTESTEPDVLEGGGAYIAAARPWLVCEVLPNRTEAKLDEFVQRNAYFRYQITLDGLTEQETIAGDATRQTRDWLFAPQRVDDALRESWRLWHDRFKSTPQGGPLGFLT